MIMLEPSVSHLTLDLFPDATAAEMWETTPFTLIANSGLTAITNYRYTSQSAK